MEYLLYIGYLLISCFLPGYILGRRKARKGIIIASVIIGVLFYALAEFGVGIGHIDRPGALSLKDSFLPICIGLLGGILCYVGGLVGKAYKA